MAFSLSALLFAISITGSFIPSFVVGAFLQFFYAEVWNIAPLYVSVIWTVYNATKLLGLMFLGVWLDTTSISKNLTCFISMMFMLVGFFGLWVKMDGVEENIQLACITFSLVIFGVGETLYTLVRSSMFQSLFDPEARSSLMVIQQLFLIIGIIVGMITPPILSSEWKHVETMNYTITACILISCLCCLVGATMRSPVAKKVETKQEKVIERSFMSELKDSLKEDHQFMNFLLASFCVNVAFNCLMNSMALYIKYMVPGVQNTLRIPYIDHELNAVAQVGIAQLLGQLISVIVSPLWVVYISRRGNVVPWKIAGIMLGVVYGSQYFLETGGFYFLIVAQVAASIFISPLNIVPPLVISKIGDEYTASHNGKSKAGFYQGLSGVSYIISSVIQGILFGIIGQFSGYDPTAPVQTATAILSINIQGLFLPAIFMATSALIIREYPKTIKIE